MKKFENVDVIDTMQQIMRHNTAYYRNDFDIDKRILTRAAQSSSPEDKAFLWMSRHAGTHCLRERDVFLKDTREYNTFRFYAEQTSDKVLAYAVAITGIKDGKIMGNVYELDYREQAQKVFREALPADTHALIYENGTRHQPANYRFDAQPDKDFGKFERFEALPNDPDALQELLRGERQAREQLAPGDVRSHVAELSDRKVMDEAQRIADAFQKLPAPNSPNKTHFMVEVSQAFLFLASSKEQERLQTMLPYKSLYLSGMKDKRGIYALINKDENRSLPLRQPRRSVRSQLKDGQEKAAAPKKAAAKKKSNDLEV